jgi:hypothetical protein
VTSSLNEFCTLFDARYLPRALAMYRSLERFCTDFRLRAVCMDDESARLLRRIDAPKLEIITLDELEEHDPELRAVRGTRSRVEYYWTSTPCVCLHSLAREPELEAITYVDADLMFFDSPELLFQELGGDSVLLVPHRFAPEYWKDSVTNGTSEESGGIYNVEFLTFRRDASGMAALRWWRERCLEWCYARIEPGRFGDQKYLDDWPRRFPDVHVLTHVGGGLAPWNSSQYALTASNGHIYVDDQPLVFHHYQSLWLHPNTRGADLLARMQAGYRRMEAPHSLLWATGWHPSERVLDLVWEPYVSAIAAAMTDLKAVGADPGIGTEPLTPRLAAGRFVRRYLPPPMRSAVWRARQRWRSLPTSISNGAIADQARSPE